MNPTDRSEMIRLMATELSESVADYHAYKSGKKTNLMGDVSFGLGAGYDFGRNDTCSATAIHRQIVALRQELLALDKQWM